MSPRSRSTGPSRNGKRNTHMEAFKPKILNLSPGLVEEPIPTTIWRIVLPEPDMSITEQDTTTIVGGLSILVQTWPGGEILREGGN